MLAPARSWSRPDREDCPGSMLDVQTNRRERQYSVKEMVGRILWSIALPFFRYSPRPCFAWRRFLLSLFGARLGREVHVYSSAVIYLPWNLSVGDWSSIGEQAFIYNLGPVEIGNRATLSQRTHLCAGTHDYRDPLMPLLKKPIRVGDMAWVCADAFVGPGVTIADGAVVGARSAVFEDVGPWEVVQGNPALFLKKRVLRCVPPGDQL